ncbi:TPA: hypothetical protein ON189_004576 [Serratia marcescens]|nr:hypothetical protein [Serratia marcescens]
MSPEMDRVLETLFSAVVDLRRMMYAIEEENHVLLPALESDARRDAYACGADLGRRALLLLELYGTRGLCFEQDVVLAGMVDAFRRCVRLSPCELEDSIARVNARVARVLPVSSFACQERRMYERFLQRPGVRRGPCGVLYVVTEPGYGLPVQDDDRVALSLSGGLADGGDVEFGGRPGMTQGTEISHLCLPLRDVARQLRCGGAAQAAISVFSLMHRAVDSNETGGDMTVYVDISIKRREREE